MDKCGSFHNHCSQNVRSIKAMFLYSDKCLMKMRLECEFGEALLGIPLCLGRVLHLALTMFSRCKPWVNGPVMALGRNFPLCFFYELLFGLKDSFEKCPWGLKETWFFSPSFCHEFEGLHIRPL